MPDEPGGGTPVQVFDRMARRYDELRQDDPSWWELFDITVEGNRPDAWCISGIARDLAGRLELPFTLPEPPAPAASGHPVEEAASASVESPDLCPRLTVSVLSDVVVGPSPEMARCGRSPRMEPTIEVRMAPGPTSTSGPSGSPARSNPL